MSNIERIETGGVTFAEVIRADTKVETSTFVSRPDSSFQMGLLAHHAGFVEPVHYHRKITRHIDDLQQFLVVQSGKIAITFHADDGALLREVVLGPGDAILLVHGAHSLRMLEDSQCLSVKQGPFLGAENDKVELQAR
jgi:hypothetical protein